MDSVKETNNVGSCQTLKVGRKNSGVNDIKIMAFVFLSFFISISLFSGVTAGQSGSFFVAALDADELKAEAQQKYEEGA